MPFALLLLQRLDQLVARQQLVVQGEPAEEVVLDLRGHERSLDQTAATGKDASRGAAGLTPGRAGTPAPGRCCRRRARASPGGRSRGRRRRSPAARAPAPRAAAGPTAPAAGRAVAAPPGRRRSAGPARAG